MNSLRALNEKVMNHLTKIYDEGGIAALDDELRKLKCTTEINIKNMSHTSLDRTTNLAHMGPDLEEKVLKSIKDYNAITPKWKFEIPLIRKEELVFREYTNKKTS